MKTTTPAPIVQIKGKKLEDLCKEVKETIANQSNIETIAQPFGVADLWRIHRSTRYRIRRRNLM